MAIGDELVLGQRVDTNTAWLSQQLFEAGIDVTVCRTAFAFRIRVSMSATVSVIMASDSYQEALRMPGTSPSSAFSRRQIRQMPNLR